MPRCRCHSRKQEKRCCGPLLAGRAAPSPVALMRSRFAAYAKGDADYIMATTHPDSPHRGADPDAWRAGIVHFCETTRFAGLSILSAPPPEGDQGEVTFHAELVQHGRDASFTERSTFRRVGGRWLYLDGEPVPDASDPTTP